MLIKSVKTLIVEDSVVLSERLAEIVHAIPELDLLAVVESQEEALAALRQNRIDVLILDLQLREGTGFGVLKSISSLSRKPQVIVLTNHDVKVYEEATQEWGVAHFLDKARDFPRLPLILGEIVHSWGRAKPLPAP